MTIEEIDNQINALVAGEQSELIILKDDFMLFLDIWNQHPEKNNIVGEAELSGKVIYRYKKD